MAVCGDPTSEHPGQTDENHGANELKAPKLKVTLTREQLGNALKNGLSITVNYRRTTTWYKAEHWVPVDLSGLPQDEISKKEKTTVDGTVYVLLDSEVLQGRVGALTNAAAKTEGSVYTRLTAMPFAQKLIKGIVSIGELDQNSVGEEDKPTVVSIYYKAAESYRVIFDTDYAYIPRLQVDFGDSVDFSAVTAVPERKGYIFDGWQYLKKDSVPDANGKYKEEDYENVVPVNGGNYTLTINEEFLNKAQFKMTDGVSSLHLYSKWKPDKTNITVVLWTEDLDGLTDVQALAEGGNVKEDGSDYYSQKYKDYKDEVTSHLPILNDSTEPNNNYSNVGSFTMQVDTGSSLADGTDTNELRSDIYAKVVDAFNASERIDGSGGQPIHFYDYFGFEVLHAKNGEIEYLKTANADGKTVVYVYFTRKIYSLKFHYYGQVWDHPFSVATHTTGYSNGGMDCYDGNGDLIFDYHGTAGSDWCSAASAEAIGTPQTITVRAKYGADLRNIWPVSRPEEKMENKDVVWESSGKDVELISWATTLGKYRNDSQPGGSHENESTIMGLFASMDEEIIADPNNAAQVHHLVAYWEKQYGISTYRYTHCYEVPGLDINSAGIETVSLYDNSTALNDLLYLVPSDNEAFTKFGFRDLLPVSYDKVTGKIEYSDYGQNNKTGYYAVRGYETVDDDNNRVTKYYAVARQIDTVSTNNIQSQNPSARAHMTKVNTVADHTSEYTDEEGSDWKWPNGTIGSTDDPYELYYYYNRDRYTITYRVSVNRSDTAETYKELGHIELPYGAHVTRDDYAFKLNYTDTNQEKEGSTAKYRWIYPDGGPVPVCPDRNPDGAKAWSF